VGWGANIRGDEKAEAQVFLDRLFRGFVTEGVFRAGATLEMRVKKGDGKGRPSLIWSGNPLFLIEMKKRGEDLTPISPAFDTGPASFSWPAAVCHPLQL